MARAAFAKRGSSRARRNRNRKFEALAPGVSYFSSMLVITSQMELKRADFFRGRQSENKSMDGPRAYCEYVAPGRASCVLQARCRGDPWVQRSKASMEGHETTRSGLVHPRYRSQWCAALRAAGNFDHADLGHKRIKIIRIVFFRWSARAGRYGSVVTYRNFCGLGLHQVV